MPSKRLLAVMDPEERHESARERRAEKKNPNLEKKEKVMSASSAAKKARSGDDMGQKGKNFSKIAAKAGKEYGSKAAGQRVAGSIFQKLRRSGKL